ncbi:mitochondrial amidoxime-reducing component 1-like [Arapaima gigas]
MELLGSLRDALAQNRRAVLWAAGIGLAAAASLGVAWGYCRKPRTAIRVGVVSQLVVYPLKSGKGLQVHGSQCLHTGLKHGELRDRHWLVISEDGHQVTGRQQPRLVLVSMTSDEDKGQVCLNAPGMAELRFPVRQPENRIANCRVWSDDIQGRDCGEEASAWITCYLACDQTFRLVQFEPKMKARKPVEKFPFFLHNDTVAYPDVGAIMLMSESSLRDLNTRLESEVTMAWFRPSVVVADCEAYAEDSWDEIQIGEVRLRRAMACSRCIFTTVNPATGVITREEPLETLKSYRMCDPSERHIYRTSPLFGQYFSVRKTGTLQVGDPVYKMTY